ncbi:MAG: hypothetical protein HFF08_03840 [Oscillospiraceae bacterium]|nr:hypothetical protein [Oscillospiraceae bacterium]
MKTYLEINGKKISMDDLLKELGVDAEPCEVNLCQDTPSGTIRAKASPDPHCPAMYLDFVRKDDPDTLPIDIAKTEGPAGCPVRTYLFDRESYHFAYSDMDTRPDAEVDKKLMSPELVVSGEPYLDTIVKLEDEFVRVYDM